MEHILEKFKMNEDEFNNINECCKLITSLFAFSLMNRPVSTWRVRILFKKSVTCCLSDF